MKRYLIVLPALLLHGCATLVRAYTERSTRKEPVVNGEHKNLPPVAGVSINSTRRLILSKDQVRTAQNYYTCSEPAPDTALNEALQTALAASAKAPKLEASLGVSDTVVLTNVILATRTELVEVWRTTGFQYCQFLMNGDRDAAGRYLDAAKLVIDKVGVAAAANGKAALEAAAAQNTTKTPAVSDISDVAGLAVPAKPVAAPSASALTPPASVPSANAIPAHKP